ncbi:MAG: M23 family metallopeptidase [Alistipes sp.]|nr:M23 family metallopeptidase [Alistipes sp.]
MKWIKSISSRWSSVMRKRRFSMHGVEAQSEEWHILISPAGVFAAITALVFLIFAVVLLLVAYTPIVEFLPGYKSSAARSRESLMESIMRLDSIERRMNDMLVYNDNISLIMNGKTPAVRTTIAADSVHRAKNLVLPSLEDSLLRVQMEGDGEYGLHTTVRTNSSMRDNMEMVVPVDGIITSHFNLREGIYGIRMASAAMAQIMAIADGVVLTSVWTPDNSNIVEIQHPNGLLSVYKNLSQVLVHKGQFVKGGEVIGYTAETPVSDGGNNFELELWNGGKAVDPEGYIVF